MGGKMLVAFLLAVLPLGHALGLELKVNETAPPAPILIDEDTWYYSENGNVDSSWGSVASIEMNGPGAMSLTIGDAQNGAASAGMDLHINGTLATQTNGAELHVVSSRGANGTGTGTRVDIGALHLEIDSNIFVGDSTKIAGPDTWRNRLAVGTLINNGIRSSITIGNDSLFEVTGAGGTTVSGLDGPVTEYFDFVLNRGTLSVRDGLTLDTARILGTGTVKDKVVLNSNSLWNPGQTTAMIRAAGGETQIYESDVAVGADGGLISVRGDAAGVAKMTVMGTLKVDGTFSDSLVEVSGADVTRMGILAAHDIELSHSARIEVGDYGRLIIGADNSTGSTYLDDGGIDVASLGEIVFNHKVELGSAANMNILGKARFAYEFSADGNTESSFGIGANVAYDQKVQLADSAAIIISNSGQVAFNDGIDMQNASRLELKNGGTADFSRATDGANLINGRLVATGSGNIVAGGLPGLTAGAVNAIQIDGQLYAMNNAADPIASGATGKATAAVPGSVLLTGGGELLAGEFVVGSGVNGGAAPAPIYSAAYDGGAPAIPAGLVRAGSFTVAEGANALGDAGVRLDVAGQGSILGSYSAVGNTDSFGGGLVVKGSLSASGVASVNLGTNLAAGGLVLDGGVLDGGAGSLSLVNTYGATPGRISVKNGARALGQIDASGFAMTAEGNLELAGANTGLQVATYTQTGGKVANGAQFSGDGIWVKDTTAPAAVSGANSVFAASAVFDGGAVFSNGAALAGGGNVITSNQSGASVRVDAASRVDLAGGNLQLIGFASLDLGGALCLGYDASADKATRLDLASGVVLNLGANARIEAGADFIAGYYNRGSFAAAPGADPSTLDWVVSGNIADWSGFANGSCVVSTVFGDFTFKSLANTDATGGGGLWLDSFKRSNLIDLAAIRNRLIRQWGTDLMSNEFAANVIAVARNMTESAANGGAPGMAGAHPSSPDSFAGNLSYRILAAMAANSPTFDCAGPGGGARGRIDASLLAAFNGHIAAGPASVARETADEMFRQINGKLSRDRELYRRVSQATGSDGALAAAVMNGRHLNRFWVGGLGLWQNADSRDGVAGYRYDGGGMLIGYDRAFGRFVAGGSFGLVSGAYADKSAAGHASTIDNYSFDLYATYNHPSFWHATVALGYTLSDNDIREYRGGNWDKADYHAGTWLAGARVGYDYPLIERLTVSPSLGLVYLHTATDAHTWKYGPVGLLRYGDMSSHTVQLPLDLALAYRMDLRSGAVLALKANAGYAYSFNGDAPSGWITINDMAGVLPVRAVGRRSGHHAYALGTGAVYEAGRMDIGVRYDFYGKADYGAHKLTGTVGLSF